MQYSVFTPLLCSLVLFANSLYAQESPSQQASKERTPFYIGGAIAGSQFDDDGFYDQQRLDDSTVGFKVYGGYRLNPYLSFEASLNSLGYYEVETTQSEVDMAFGALTASALGRLPLGQGFELFGQLGVGFASVSQDISFATSSGQLITDDEDDASGVIVYGLGVNYVPPGLKFIQFRFGWERYAFSVDTFRIDNGVIIKGDGDQEIDQIHLGAAYIF